MESKAALEVIIVKSKRNVFSCGARESVASDISDFRGAEGLYRLEGRRPVFTILTRAPGEEIAFLHDRMPMLLPRDAVAHWMDPASDPLEALERAATTVAFERVPGEMEQIGMEL